MLALTSICFRADSLGTMISSSVGRRERVRDVDSPLRPLADEPAVLCLAAFLLVDLRPASLFGLVGAGASTRRTSTFCPFTRTVLCSSTVPPAEDLRTISGPFLRNRAICSHSSEMCMWSHTHSWWDTTERVERRGRRERRAQNASRLFKDNRSLRGYRLAPPISRARGQAVPAHWGRNTSDIALRRRPERRGPRGRLTGRSAVCTTPGRHNDDIRRASW